jgi:glycosyltransferase involved in cell wall biosynthesis
LIDCVRIMKDHPLTIVSLQNHYLNRGGEDEVFETEAELLEAHGHRVIRVEDWNREPAGWRDVSELACDAVWSTTWHDRLQQLLQQNKPDVVHIHNWWSLMSPSVCYAAHRVGVPVVHTLHNYRLLCPNAIFFRDGRPCEDCLGKIIPWPGVLHGCYQASRARTAVIATVLAYHRHRKTWNEQVDVYVVPSEFARARFIAGGLPAEKIVVRPNFLCPTPALGEGRGGYALFVGRLVEQKGISVLLAAWERLQDKLPLKIVGDGPISVEVEAATRRLHGVEWLGRQPREAVMKLMQEAAALIFPSVCYETFGMSIIEAFAAGTPVIASNLGAMSELVEHERTGLHFDSGDPVDLAAQVNWMLGHPHEWNEMRQNARLEFETRYTAELNYDGLIRIYERAIEHANSEKMTR